MLTTDIVDCIKSLFSEQGLIFGSFSVQCEEEVSMTVKKTESGVHVNFDSNRKPLVNTKRKFLKFSLVVLGINFLEDKLILELDNFPDIPIAYDRID